MDNVQLLKKYLEGTCTPDELNQVLAYVSTQEGKQHLDTLLRSEEQRSAFFPPPSPAVSDRMYRRLTTDINRSKTKFSWQVAATGVLVLLSAALFWWLRPHPVTYATEYGEVKTIWLPDSSSVILNGNTRLTLATDWSTSREVWLDGEAYFQVRKLALPLAGSEPKPAKKYVKFTVHAQDLNVEVLGTEFNVRHRSKQTSVVLKSGQVRLNRLSQPDTLTMRPGEIVTLSDRNQTLEKQTVNPQTYIGWTEQRLEFDGTPLIEIADILEETYGYQVTILDTSLHHRQFQGSIPTDDIAILLEGLAEALDVRVTQQGNQITINKP